MLVSIGMYINRIQNFLNTEDLEVLETPFGYIAIKGNYIPSSSVDEVYIEGIPLNLRGRILHERVLLIQKPIGIRSHEEEDEEIIKNIWGNPIEYIPHPGSPISIEPGATQYSVKGKEGFYHGFDVKKGDGLLYVAKALFPGFAEGRSFRLSGSVNYADIEK